MFPAAGGALIAYALGVPAVFLWRLIKHREVLQAPAAQMQLGFLYRDYNDTYFFWEGTSRSLHLRQHTASASLHASLLPSLRLHASAMA